MQWVKQHDVGFGECVVIGGKHREILMVDCGTIRPRLADGTLFREYVEQIQDQYGSAEERSFLLSHFHKDHYCGLPLLLRGDPQYFDRIYIPCCPVDHRGVPLLTELSIWIESFVTGAGSETVKMNGANLRFFREICNLATTEVIYTLGAGDILEFDKEDYTILWPPEKNYPFSLTLRKLIASCNAILRESYDPCAESFLILKRQLCESYVRCMKSFSPETDADQSERQKCVEDLFDLMQELNWLLPYLHTMRVANRVSALLHDRATIMAVSHEINGSSLVLSSEKVLFTGDATPETMNRIAPNLQEAYMLVKAPHHGTESCWWEGFSEMGIRHLLISNGVGCGGKIASQYAALNVLHHCTGADHCQHIDAGNSCCNASLYCPECSPCRANPTQCRRPGCSVYLEGRTYSHPCRCTEKFG